MKRSSSDEIYSIRAVHRVCDVLDLVQQRPEGVSLNDVDEVVDFPKSTGYRYLSSLEQRQYLVRDHATGLYHMGPAFLPGHPRHMTVLADRIRPALSRLRDDLGETLNLGVLDGYRVSYVDIIESPNTVRLAARKGDRDYVHCTALGKAIASTLDDERVESILSADGMPRRTTATITSPDRFRDELKQIHAQGYALDDCENEDHGRCVAIPLSGVAPPAAISLAAPASRLSLDDVPRVAEALRQCVEQFTGAD